MPEWSYGRDSLQLEAWTDFEIKHIQLKQNVLWSFTTSSLSASPKRKEKMHVWWSSRITRTLLSSNQQVRSVLKFLANAVTAYRSNRMFFWCRLWIPRRTIGILIDSLSGTICNCHKQLASFSHETAVSVKTPTPGHCRLANLYTEWTGALIGSVSCISIATCQSPPQFFQSIRAENWHRFIVKEEVWRICFSF